MDWVHLNQTEDSLPEVVDYNFAKFVTLLVDEDESVRIFESHQNLPFFLIGTNGTFLDFQTLHLSKSELFWTKCHYRVCPYSRCIN